MSAHKWAATADGGVSSSAHERASAVAVDASRALALCRLHARSRRAATCLTDTHTYHQSLQRIRCID